MHHGVYSLKINGARVVHDAISPALYLDPCLEYAPHQTPMHTHTKGQFRVGLNLQPATQSGRINDKEPHAHFIYYTREMA